MSPLGDHISVGPVVPDQSPEEVRALRCAKWSNVGLALMFIAFMLSQFALWERDAEADRLRAQLAKDVVTMEAARKVTERAVWEAQQATNLAGLCVLGPIEGRKEMQRVGPIE